jgi:hypothetical protein
MLERNEYRQILLDARELGRIPIAPGDSSAAKELVRRQLFRTTFAAEYTRRRKNLLVMSGGVAAAIGLVIAFAVTTMLPRKLDAAEQLGNAASATKSYQGWVHIVPAETGGWLAIFRPKIHAIHINTIDGRFAVEANVFGTRLVQLAIPARREMWMYTGMSHRVLIVSLDVDNSAQSFKRNAEFPLKLAAMLEQMKVSGAPQPRVVQTIDKGLERFDLTVTKDARNQVNEYMPTGKMSIWIDPQTKLIRRIESPIDGKPTLMEYTYGDPQIRDIYDLEVPRDSEVVDMRQPAATTQPLAPVFNLPSITRLTKNESFDRQALVDRLRKRSQADWGDFVSVECNEIKGEYHRQGQLTLTARQGDAGFSAIYLLAPEMTLWGGAGFPKGWPIPTPADVAAHLKYARPLRLSAFDGKKGWQIQTSLSGPAPTTQVSIPFEAKTPILLWSMLQDAQGGFGKSTTEVLSDPDHPGLIVLHQDTTSPFRLANAKSDYHNETWTWLDPAHDDLPVETLIHNNSDGGDKLDTSMHFIYLDFARTDDGKWYPSHWQYRTSRPPTTQPIQDAGYVEYWRQILQHEKLPSEWYGDPSSRMSGARASAPAPKPSTLP